MFIPIGDSNIRLRKPYITYGIIIANFAIYFYQLSLPHSELKQWFLTLGLVPSKVFTGEVISTIKSFFTSLFVHAGFAHIAGNMLYLWIFGDNIEGTLGHFKYAVFYLCCGIFASLVQTFINPASDLPIIGASGAISGILGAYLLKYPRARVHVIIFLIFFIQKISIPAVYVLGFWFLVQLTNGLGALSFQQEGGVAWFAHIGGFLMGIFLLLMFDPYERKRLWREMNRYQ